MDRSVLFEVRRKIVHLVTGLTIVILYSMGFFTPFFLFLLLLITTLASYISAKSNIKIPIFYELIEYFEREELKKTFPLRGLIAFLTGSLLSVILFPRNIAMASILVLTFGDSVSCMIGLYFKIKNNISYKDKLISGSIFGFFAAFIASLFYVSIIEAFVASGAAMLVEFYEFDWNKKPIDDNILLPLVAGTAVLILLKFVKIIV